MNYNPPRKDLWSLEKKKFQNNDWITGLPTTYKHTKKEQSKCLCGNPRKLKQLVERFSRTSSLHGAQYVCSKRNSNRILRIFYRVLFTFCMLSVIGSVIFLAQESMKKESIFINTINRDYDSGILEDPLFPYFPSVIICRKPSYKTDMNDTFLELLEYVHLALGYPFVTLTPEETSFLIQIARAQNSELLSKFSPKAAAFKEKLMNMEKRYNNFKTNTSEFDLKTFISENSFSCKDIFESCFLTVFEIPCCKSFVPMLTSEGVCYIMEKNEELRVLGKGLKATGFSLIFDLYYYSNAKKAVDVGFKVFLFDPLEKPVTYNPRDGINMVPSFITYMNVKLEKTQRKALYTPWHGLYANCPDLPSHLENETDADERYSIRKCEKTFFFRDIRDNCDCVSLLHLGNTSSRPCEPVDMYYCSIVNAMKDNLTRVQEACRDACIEYSYISDVSYIGLGGANKSRLMITYDAGQYVHNEYQATTLSSFLSQIGGSLGLYLGASIITAMELITFISSWLWYRFIPSRGNRVVQNNLKRNSS